ncbi:hypothetical protein L0Y65_05255 [Candidatus Micrarchaeota archaeon]|nr:hypothetical protein [Candidatus Micrarchaeota archaeon]
MSKLKPTNPDNGKIANSRSGFAAMAVLLGTVSLSGCTYESKGLPGIDASRKDGRHDISRSERMPDSKGRDTNPADSLRGDLKAQDFLAKDISVQDTSKPDGSKSDAVKPDSAKPDSFKPDSKPDAVKSCPTASAESFSGIISTGTPLFVGGYRFDFKGTSGIYAIFDISCNGSPVATGKACAVGSDTVIPVPADNRMITIRPITAGAANSNASIKVELP